MKMKSKKGKNMLALLLAFAMIVTGIVVTPVNAQAAKKEKKATIADMYAYGDLALSTQEGYYEKKPYQISVKDAIVNRNKKGKIHILFLQYQKNQSYKKWKDNIC